MAGFFLREAGMRRRKQKLPNHYRVRSEALKQLGFESYEQYLASDLWVEIRTRIMQRDGGKCLACGKDAYTVHHTTYSVAVLAGKANNQLVSVCRRCHHRAEFSGPKKKTDSFSVYKALKRGQSKESILKQKVVSNRFRPMCRCCRQPKKKPLGRNGICLGCFKRYKERVHEIAAEREQKALAS